MSITVILVDDHAAFREGLHLLLETQSDIRVVAETADGAEAERLARECHADVVVMDIGMPGLNGIEATERIVEGCASTQVVVLSAHGSVEHLLRALRAGARGYVLKESAGSEVISAVRAVYAGERYLCKGIAHGLSLGVTDGLDIIEGKSPLAKLSTREREVLRLVVQGKTSAEIAALLYLSPKTVDTYRSRLMRKLAIHDVPGLVRFAIQYGLIPLDE